MLFFSLMTTLLSSSFPVIALAPDDLYRNRQDFQGKLQVCGSSEYVLVDIHVLSNDHMYHVLPCIITSSLMGWGELKSVLKHIPNITLFTRQCFTIIKNP